MRMTFVGGSAYQDSPWPGRQEELFPVCMGEPSAPGLWPVLGPLEGVGSGGGRGGSGRAEPQPGPGSWTAFLRQDRMRTPSPSPASGTRQDRSLRGLSACGPVWPTGWRSQPHLGACWKCRSPDPVLHPAGHTLHLRHPRQWVRDTKAPAGKTAHLPRGTGRGPWTDLNLSPRSPPLPWGCQPL